MKTIEDVMITTRLLPHARRTPSLMLPAALAAAMFFAIVPAARAQQNYKTVDAAVDALVATAKSGDQKAALVVLGPGGDDIISSGDKVADDAARARFVASYETKHEIKMEGDDKASLIIGDNDYPFPIPPCARTANGCSIPKRAAAKFSRGASVTMNSTPFRSVSLSS